MVMQYIVFYKNDHNHMTVYYKLRFPAESAMIYARKESMRQGTEERQHDDEEEVRIRIIIA